MTDRYRILATNALDPAATLILAGAEMVVAPDVRSETLRRMIGDFDALIVRVKLPDDIFSHTTRLKACVRHGVGLDFIPLDAATRAYIPVANLTDANTQAVVEHVAGCVLVLARGLHDLANRFHASGWRARTGYVGAELHGRTLGVVGLGRIGLGVARALHHGFGMEVIGFDPKLSERPSWIRMMALNDVFSGADIITLHAPLTRATHGLVNAERLALMRSGAFLVNAARGALVDDQALIAALQSGRLAAAALDVFEPEPLLDNHPFHSTPNLFLTPHTAGLTHDSMKRMSMQAVEETLRILKGERPVNLVNPEIWEDYLKRRNLRPIRTNQQE